MQSLSSSPAWLGPPIVTEAPDAIQALAWHPSEPRCTVGLVEGDVLDWEAHGSLQAPRKAHEDGLLALTWNPQGSCLATAGQDGCVRLWDAAGQPLHALEQPEKWVGVLAWSADGAWLAVGCGRQLEIFDCRGPNPKSFGQFGPHASTITGIAWLPNEAGVAVAAYGGVTVWPGPFADRSLWERIKGAAPPEPRHLPFKGSLLALAVSPDGRFYATGNQDGTVHLWYAADGVDLEMTGYPTKVRELAWDPRSRFVATGGSPNVTIWDMRGRGPAGSRPLVLEGHTDFITAMAFQPAGELLATAGRDSEVFFWRPLRGLELRGRDIQGHAFLGEAAATLAWRPDGKYLLVAGRNGRLLGTPVNR